MVVVAMVKSKVELAPALPESKLEKIQYLLDHWEDIFDPSGTSAVGSPGDGSGVALLPLMSRHRSVRELERCLGVLGVEAPGQLAHLKAFRCAEWRIRVDRVRVTRPRRQGKRVQSEQVERRSRERVVPGWVRQEKVRLAEGRLVKLFRGQVDIPGELWDSLVLSSEDVEAKRRRKLRGAA